MALGFDERLKREIRRRDAAMLQMKLAADATSNIVSQKVGELKTDLRTQLNPEKVIAQHPWPSVLAGLVAGALSAFLVKSRVFPGPQRVSIVGAGQPQPPQKVVIEVVGAGTQKKAQPSIWKPILDAAMAGAPAVAAYVQQLMQESQHNGHGPAEVEEKKPTAVSEPAPAAKPAASGSFPASISRRTAPPPRENS